MAEAMTVPVQVSLRKQLFMSLYFFVGARGGGKMKIEISQLYPELSRWRCKMADLVKVIIGIFHRP